jgi:hypothetical protein
MKIALFALFISIVIALLTPLILTLVVFYGLYIAIKWIANKKKIESKTVSGWQVY